MADDFILGSHWVTDGKTGQKIRASDARTQWDGIVTHKDHFESRHPQDFIRSRAETAQVDNPRPKPAITYQGPLKTLLGADHAAGATTITVESTVRMEAGDRIEILLDSGDVHRTIILTVTDTTTITINNALPGAASTGNVLTDYTAYSPSDLE